MQIDARKAHCPGMPNDVGEGNAASPALRGVHPIASPGIRDSVAVSAIPDIEAIQTMEGNRQPDANEFKKEDKRKIAEKTYLAGIGVRSANGGRIRNENMFKQKSADWNDARKGMQTA